MPQGLQIWNSAGTLILDATDNIVKFLGVANIGTSYTGSTASGSVTDSRLTSLAGNTPFVAIIRGDTWGHDISPRLSVVGNSVNWVFPHASLRPDTTFVYGVL